MGRPVHDIDAEIVRREGCTIGELFSRRGEAAFRDMESQVTRELLAGPPSVIAAGGGWVLTESNLAEAADTAVVVHLAVTPATAAVRLGHGSGDRPLLASADPRTRLEELEEARRERYARADVVVNTEDLDTEEVARSILLLIERSA